MSIFKRYFRPIFLFAAIAMLFAGCKDDGDDSPVVELRADYVDCNTTTNRIVVTGDAMTYRATILSQGEGDAWCSFGSFDTAAEPQLSKEGHVGIPMTVYLRRNEQDTERTATIEVVLASGKTRQLTFTQGAYSETAFYDRKWGEQPAWRENSTYIYKTYYTDLTRGGHVRNYSICFDTEKHVSRWVAYPLTRNYVEPSFARPNPEPWAYDPNTQQPEIPQSVQSNLTGNRGYFSRGARGHQIPSADRYSTKETNAMTFYATNIMPQNSSFNSGIWAILESKIRDVRTRYPSDTLFVVTGTHFATTETVTDQNGLRISYPSNCWKVLLRGSGGRAVWNCTADQLYAIGFWFANDASNTGTLGSYATTVADIEEKTGFTFFRNIPAEAAAAVKAQNHPADWGL